MRTSFTVAPIFLIFWVSSALAGPQTINLQGTLSNADGPLTGQRAWRVQFYDAETGGNPLGAALTGNCTVAASGRWAISLTPPAAVLDTSSAVWYELAIDSAATPDSTIDADDVFSDRVQVHSVLFARRADKATTATHAATADDADTLDGVQGADFATDVELTNGLAAKADTGHDHAFSEITGTATDGQIPDTITIDHAADADTATTATWAMNLAGSAKVNRQAAQYIVVSLSSGNTDSENGAALLAAYDEAKALSPSASNRVALLIPPARYDLGTDALTLDTAYLDCIGLSSDRAAQHIYGESNGANSGVVMQTVDNVRLENLTVECTDTTSGAGRNDSTQAAYWPNVTWNTSHTGSGPNTAIHNCAFVSNDTNAWSMRAAVEYAGEYVDCSGGDYAFGGLGMASGTFTRCEAGDYAFAAAYLISGTSEASGTFTDCVGGDYAFAGAFGNGADGSASGDFIRCTGGDQSFGSASQSGATATASGTFQDCTGGLRAFGGAASSATGTASGTFMGCTGGQFAFGGGQSATGSSTGLFRNCRGGLYAFGGASGDTASGTFINCEMTGASWSGDFSGIMENCRWSAGITCAADGEIYDSSFDGDVDLNDTNAGMRGSYVSGTILRASSAAFLHDNTDSTGAVPALASGDFKADGSVAMTGDLDLGGNGIANLGTDLADADVADNLTLSGGTVDDTVIGGATPAAGTFTTLAADTVNTGEGTTEVYPMDQAVRTSDSVSFQGLTVGNGIVLDQSNTGATGSGRLFDTGHMAAQVFTPSASGYVARCSLKLSTFGGFGEVLIGIYSGTPGSGSLISSEESVMVFGMSFEQFDVSFSSPASVVSGQSYYVRMESRFDTLNVPIFDTSPQLGGFYHNNGFGWGPDTEDTWYQIYLDSGEKLSVNGPVEIADSGSAPATSANHLYNKDGGLYWNGGRIDKGTKVIMVSAEGTGAENGQALINAYNSITDASATNPYVVLAGPGIYDMAYVSFSLKSYVSLMGYGPEATTIKYAVSGLDATAFHVASAVIGARISDLSVIISISGGSDAASLLKIDGDCDLVMEDIHADIRGDSAYGAYLTSDSAIDLLWQNMQLNVKGVSGNGGDVCGIMDSLPAGTANQSIELRNVEIVSDGIDSADAYGIRSEYVDDIFVKDSSISLPGGSMLYTLFLTGSGEVRLIESEIWVGTGVGFAYGYVLEADTTGYLRMANCLYDASVDSDATAGHVYMTNCYDADFAPLADLAP